MKRVAESCGALGLGTVDRILRNLRFDLSQRKVLWYLTKPSICRLSAWRRYGNYWINLPIAGCYSPAPTN